MTSSTDTGTSLIEAGWEQGSLLPAAGYVSLAQSPGGDWTSSLVPPAEPLERWIVVSQDCDILSSAEPYIEVMACYWSRRGDRAYNGSRSGNSSRYFRVTELEHEGKRGALIVDATKRAQVAKGSLVGTTPINPDADDPAFARSFRRWLGGRYSRPPLSPKVVDAIQRPVVDGIKDLAKVDSLADEAQELVREVRIYPLGDDPPYDVTIIMLIQEEVDDDDVRLAALRGWIEMWLRASPDDIRSVTIESLRASEMYVTEYENTLKLPLDHYSAGEDGQKSGPVVGIDHG